MKTAVTLLIVCVCFLLAPSSPTTTKAPDTVSWQTVLGFLGVGAPIVLGILMFFVKRSLAAEQKLQSETIARLEGDNKQQRRLLEQQIASNEGTRQQAETQAGETLKRLEATLDKIQEKMGHIDRDLLKHQTGCLQTFVQRAAYDTAMSAQTQEVQAIHALIAEQVDYLRKLTSDR